MNPLGRSDRLSRFSDTIIARWHEPRHRDGAGRRDNDESAQSLDRSLFRLAPLSPLIYFSTRTLAHFSLVSSYYLQRQKCDWIPVSFSVQGGGSIHQRAWLLGAGT